MDEVGHILVRVFSSVIFAKLVITFAFVILNLHEIFRFYVKLNFFLMSMLLLHIGIFDFSLSKNLAAKFHNFSGKLHAKKLKMQKLLRVNSKAR